MAAESEALCRVAAPDWTPGVCRRPIWRHGTTEHLGSGASDAKLYRVSPASRPQDLGAIIMRGKEKTPFLIGKVGGAFIPQVNTVFLTELQCHCVRTLIPFLGTRPFHAERVRKYLSSMVRPDENGNKKNKLC